MLGSDEGTKQALFDGKVIVTILGDVNWINVALGVGTYLDSVYGSFDGSNDGKLEGLLLRY